MMTFLVSSPALAQKQQKLSDEEIGKIAELMKRNPRCTTHVMWLEDESRMSYFLRTVPGRCLSDLEEVAEMAEKWHESNAAIVQLAEQIYPKPGSKKSEKSLSKYFADPAAARNTFECARQAEALYERFMREVRPAIVIKSKQTFNVPQGALTYFEFRQGGGMIHRPPTQAVLKRNEDNSYTLTIDTEDFQRLDTISVSQAQADELRALLIEGEVYKMPSFSDSPIMIHDAPHSSVAVKFTDGTYSCNGFPPKDYGGKNIWKAYRYLKDLQPKQEQQHTEH